jgi:hypothetical protein
MATREDFLRQIWREVINSPMREDWIDSAISESENWPDAPFADQGRALQRLLALGASRTDLSLVSRSAAYEAAFAILYMLGDPGVDDGNIENLHESLLGADPSSKEGSTGSAPTSDA